MREQWLDELGSRLLPVDTEPALPGDLRRAAVLALIHCREHEAVIPLIERSVGGGVHSGQLALPGGAFEDSDEWLVVTALREAREEVGLEARSVRVLGRLPHVHVTVSGFVVVPFVAWSDECPDLYPNDSEVAAIIELPVKLLADKTAAREIPNPPGSRHPVMYEYALPAGRLWGATARMLHNLGDVLPPLDRC